MAVRFCDECGHNVKMPHRCPKKAKKPKDDPLPKQKLYAFWDYDLCPYMIGGEVKKFMENGNVIPKNYQGMQFKPIAILPDQAGKNALEFLNKIRHDYAVAEKKLKLKYKNAARKLIGLSKKEE